MIQPIAVIGAGPFGLSIAAHLRARGVPVRVFGEPMVSWRDHMPAGMLLKSTPVASNIDAPQRGHTLVDYCDAAGLPRLVTNEDIIPVEAFIGYGEWFQQRLVPELERARVVSVERHERAGFELELDSGELLTARAVVVATGLSGLAHLPRELVPRQATFAPSRRPARPLAAPAESPSTSRPFGRTTPSGRHAESTHRAPLLDGQTLPAAALAGAAADGPTPTGPVSHSSQQHDLTRYAGRELIVVGAGQSALETAVLAAEAGARVRVVARGRGKVAFGDPPWKQPRLRPESPFGRAWSLWALSHYPHPYRCLPAGLRHYLVRRVLGPLGAWWLRDRFEGAVRVSEVAGVVGADAADGRTTLTVRTLGGRTQQLSADHVIAATGYRVDLAALDFLGPALRTELAVSRGAPKLGAGYVSSVSGLYFTGLPAAASYGPVMRFVCGTEFASPRLARHLVAAHG